MVNNNQEVPMKRMREWKLLLVKNIPLAESFEIALDADAVTRVHHEHVEDHHNDVVLVVEPLRDSVLVLDAQEFCDYLEYEGMWKSTTEESVITNDRTILQRNEYLANMVEAVINLTMIPPTPKQIAVIPSVPLRISVIGKRYSGKNTISKLATNYNMTALRLDELIKDAIRYWNTSP